jgi:hypothetical protein
MATWKVLCDMAQLAPIWTLMEMTIPSYVPVVKSEAERWFASRRWGEPPLPVYPTILGRAGCGIPVGVAVGVRVAVGLLVGLGAPTAGSKSPALPETILAGFTPPVRARAVLSRLACVS